jgi:hypothetical protein
LGAVSRNPTDDLGSHSMARAVGEVANE